MYMYFQNDENCIKCPVCRKSFTLPKGGATKLPPAFMINHLLDLHQKTPKSMLYTPGNCPIHNDPLKVYCETCDEVICRDCTISEKHNTHNHQLISECYHKHKEQLQNCLNRVEIKLPDIDNAVKSLAAAKMEVLQQGNELKKAIDIQAQQIIDEIEKNRTHLLQQVDTAVRKKECLLEKQCEYAQQKRVQLKTCQETVENTLNECTEQQLLQSKTTIMKETSTALICADPKAFESLEKADMEFIPIEITEMKIGEFKNNSTTAQASLCQSTEQSNAIDICTLTLKSQDVPFPLPPSLISAHLISPTTDKPHQDVQCDITQIHPGKYSIPFTPSTRQDRLLIRIHAEGIDIDVPDFPLIPKPEMRGEPLKIIHVPGMNLPIGIAVFDNGDIAVADNGAQCIRILNKKGEQMTTTKGTKKMEFKNLNAVAISLDGHILAINGNILLKLTSNGVCVKSVGKEAKGNGKLEFNNPKGIVSHPQTGRVFVADYSNSRIQVFTKDLAYCHTIARPGGKILKQPHDVAVDNAGHLYIAEKCNNCITKLTTDGKYVTRFTHPQLSTPSSLAIHDNLVYVGNSYVSIFDTNGNLQHCLPKCERGFNKPHYTIAIHKSGVDLYIADSLKKTITIV